METEMIMMETEDVTPAEETQDFGSLESETEGIVANTSGDGDEDSGTYESEAVAPFQQEDSSEDLAGQHYEESEEDSQLVRIACPVCGEVFFEAYMDEGEDISAICPVCTSKILSADDVSAAAVEIMLSGLKDQADHAEQHHVDEIEAIRAHYESAIATLEHRISEMEQQHSEELEDQLKTVTQTYESKIAELKAQHSRSLSIISDFIAKVK